MSVVALDFRKGDKVAVFEAVAGFFEAVDDALGFWGDGGDEAVERFFAVGVVDFKVLTIVNKNMTFFLRLEQDMEEGVKDQSSKSLFSKIIKYVFVDSDSFGQCEIYNS